MSGTGMKRLMRAFRTCMVLSLPSSTFAACAPTETPAPPPTETRAAMIAKLSGDPAVGASDYQVHCKSCHGSPMQAGRITADIAAYARGTQPGFLAQVLYGGRGMPPFETLSDAQIANIYAYVKAP
jgi:mono/diheme cytochrome c family protein